MRLEWYIAHRYLRGAHRGRALISVAGVTVGVTVLIVVISVINGFERDFLGKMLGAYGHIKLYPAEFGRAVDNLYQYEKWVSILKNEPGIRGVSPIVETGVTMLVDPDGSGRGRGQYVQVRGIDPVLEVNVSDMIQGKLVGEWSSLASKPHVKAGTETSLIDPFAVESETPGVFLGIELAKDLLNGAGDRNNWTERDPGFEAFALKNILGQKVSLVAPRIDRAASGMQPFFFEAKVVGLFKTGFFDIDLHSSLVSLDTARVLKGLPAGEDSVECLEVRLHDPAPQNTYNIAKHLVDFTSIAYNGSFVAVPWMYLNQTLVRAVQIEKVVMGSILTLVVLVAAFGIASTLVMTVLEKTREIGTLMAMGTRRRSIMEIFILNGFQVGVIGSFFGVILGLGISWLAAYLEIPMPGDGSLYVLDVLPVEVRWLDVTAIALFSVVASTLAGIYPAWKAARMQPVEALSYE
jgi:lipoprotein-releasing system permease protein